jgi:hypothetical protein
MVGGVIRLCLDFWNEEAREASQVIFGGRGEFKQLKENGL